MRLGEVEPVFGQTGRVVLDITARTAHDGALNWTRAPSTPRAARSIFATFPSTCALPSGGRWSVRRVLQRPGRQRTRRRREAQLRPVRHAPAAAERRPGDRQRSQLPGHDRCGRVRRRPPHPRAATRGALRRGWRRGERPRAPPAPAACGATRCPARAVRGARFRCRRSLRMTAHRDRQRSHLPGHDGAGHDAVLPRETRPSGARGGRDSTPPWWCWASTTGATCAARPPTTRPAVGRRSTAAPICASTRASTASVLARHAQLAGGSAGAAPLRRQRPGYQDPPLDRLSLRCAGPSGPACPAALCQSARRAVCWTA